MIFRLLDQVRYITLYYKTLQTTKTKITLFLGSVIYIKLMRVVFHYE